MEISRIRGELPSVCLPGASGVRTRLVSKTEACHRNFRNSRSQSEKTQFRKAAVQKRDGQIKFLTYLPFSCHIMFFSFFTDNSIADYEKKRQNKQREQGVKC
ncbi:hypothetical protein DXA65_04255 [Ruminococcus sp. OF03-6AA]|nr:hypothetical protein DXA65_04255 [Ruminococcus sp. OF03-6AA]